MNESQRIFAGMQIKSIEANAVSLFAQLNEYDWLDITAEQFSKLVQIDLDFRVLVKQITDK
jgi:hypothetical protein